MKEIDYKSAKLRITPTLLVLICITILGGILRLRGIDNRGLWNDELWSVFYSSTRHIKNIWQMLELIGSNSPINPPLHSIIMRGWIAWFGDGVISLRLPSAIFGTISIPLIYLVSKQIVSERASLIAATLLTIFPIHIFYSQEARNYTLFLMLSLLSMNYLFKLNNNFKKTDYLGYLFSTILLLYTHYFGFFLILIQLTYILFKKINLKKWLLVYLSILIAYLPWLVPFMRNSETLVSGSWISRVGVVDGMLAQLNFFNPTLSFFPLNNLYSALLVIGLLSVIYIYNLNKHQNAILLIYWLLIPIVTPLVLSQFFKPFFVERYAFITLAPFIILISLGIESFTKWTKVYYLLLIFIFSLTLYSTKYTPPNVSVENWPTLVSYVSDNLSSNTESIFVYPETNATLMGIEYYSPSKLIKIARINELVNSQIECPDSFYLISRYENVKLNLSCNFTSSIIIENGPPYLYKYSLSN